MRALRPRDDNEHVYHLYVVRMRGGAEERGRVLGALHERGIGAGLHYPTPLHRTGAYADQGLGAGSFPAAEAAADEILSLPLFPQITAEQQERVVHELRRALA